MTNSFSLWPELYFIRHGQTDWNAEGRYQGTQDIPLNAVGRAQADANGPLLRMLLEREGRSATDFDWFATPLGRTQETARRILAAFEPPHPAVRIDKRLVEISFGVYEGRQVQELADHPMLAPGSRDETFWSYRPEKGENYDDVVVRLEDFARTLTRPTIMIGHGGILRVLRHLIAGASQVDVVNWSTPQDVVYHFTNAQMIERPASAAWVD